jgi:hypothetical protein
MTAKVLADFEPIKSSNLSGARRNDDGTVDVKYKSGTYRYHDFAPDDWNRLQQTFQTDESTGSMLRQMIRGLEYEKLGE